MAHQNAAARYDAKHYVPADWELANAGNLLIYDNYIQLGEEFYRQGRPANAFRCYQKGLDHQDHLRSSFPIPQSLRDEISAHCPTFDVDLPICLLGYEWVTQLGHIGFLDLHLRMGQTETTAGTNHVLFAPERKIANSALLRYFDKMLCIVKDDKLVDKLLPYQRIVGDQFIAVRGRRDTAEPWARAAARAQKTWAETGRGPLISLAPEDRNFGNDVLKSLGLRPGDWYVGLHVREGGLYGDGGGTIASHRSANIEDYKSAIEEITEAGGWVFRLGDPTMRPLSPLPRVIDYAHSRFRSPRMDVFLFATSRFVIGTTSGLTTAVQAFGTPLLVVNAISNDCQPWTANTHFLPKRIYDRRNKRFLTVREMISETVRPLLINSSLLQRNGYGACSNRAAEIKEAVRYKLDLTTMPAAGRRKEEDPLFDLYDDCIAADPYVFGAARPALPFLRSNVDFLSGLPGDPSQLTIRRSSMIGATAP
jgi:putative glycosyltransferase (TIGR04372 family)